VSDASPKRGGRRPGAGRPTSAAREEAAEKAARKIVGALKDADPYTALQRVLAYHDKAFAECAAKLPTASRTNAFLIAKDMQAHSLAIRLTVEQMNKFPAPQPDVAQCVIWAPQICKTAEEWTAKYKPPPDAPEKPAASPEIEKLRVAAEALADRPKPRLVVDNDPQPPRRYEPLEPSPYLTGCGPQEYGPLGPEQLADLKRRGRL